MPTNRVTQLAGAEGVATAIALLEADNNDVLSVVQVGDEYLILYKPKSRPKSGPR